MFKSSILLRLVSFTFFILLTGLAYQACAQENAFTYKDFSLSLPEGWSAQEIPKGSEKEVIGSLKAEKIAGTTVLVFCYSSWKHNYNSVRILGRKRLLRSTQKVKRCLRNRRR